jgi:predicted transcriptional regulator
MYHVTDHVKSLLKIIQGEMSRNELMVNLNLTGRASFREKYLKPALEQGFVEMTISEKPKSRLQKYRRTPAGTKMISEETIATNEGQGISQVTGHVSDHVKSLLKIIQGEMSRNELMTNLNLTGRANFKEEYLKPALEQGLVKMTIPEKPKSRLQKYRLTPAGLKLQQNQSEGSHE